MTGILSPTVGPHGEAPVVSPARRCRQDARAGASLSLAGRSGRRRHAPEVR